MNLTIITNMKHVYEAVKWEILTNATVYNGKMFDTQNDFIEHLYRLAMVLSKKNTVLETDFDRSKTIRVNNIPRGKYQNTFII